MMVGRLIMTALMMIVSCVFHIDAMYFRALSDLVWRNDDEDDPKRLS